MKNQKEMKKNKMENCKTSDCKSSKQPKRKKDMNPEMK
ncbi:hypothetical protein QOZ93_000421 [Hathewaya limosa]|uniref:Uncharacterized protein n=1 Tax=Hathewaya limosa TaxID=1536 RepID=A0ABU0JNP9_HATLI|nr:hypothetical protein [Hathewaya limosa]